ncbi:MAG TPA: glycosyltransferase family 2 protein [Acidimicrobiales bacterium]|nr:glycosyltransferase family 2 protein [Acidimicrobiales bacterium]
MAVATPAVGQQRSSRKATHRRRRYGRAEPLPPVATPAPDSTAAIGRLAIFVTVAGWVVFIATTVATQFFAGRATTLRFKWEAVLYMVVVSFLTLSSLSYLTARLGYYLRIRSHRRVPRAAVDDFLSRTHHTLTCLVPSYQEDEHIIRMTLFSAALQEYPDMEVVLLIDDPPEPRTARGRRLLAQVRALPASVQDALARPLADAVGRVGDIVEGYVPDDLAGRHDQLGRLAEAYSASAGWLLDLAGAHPRDSHVDDFFADHVLGRLARDLQAVGAAIAQARAEGAQIDPGRVRQLATRLVNVFSARLGSFERKQYESLSHEPNKAMNLNSYLGLMGGRYRDEFTPAGRVLTEVGPDEPADLEVTNPDFVLTLDADSVLLPEYCARLVYLLSLEGNQRVAIAQTPYSAYPGPASRLERIAGASTDLQFMVHQGLTYHDATFWVGANAVLRKEALDDIDVASQDGNWTIHRYISDRTVIEDTESTVTLGTKGWKLVNYPERLSYSATPPDFGALTVQRRRWADGGLIIVPRLLRHARKKDDRGLRPSAGETFLRLNYMASIAWSTVCLLLLLAYPFNYQLLSPVVLVVALPYFLMMAVDLHHAGYKRTDVFRVYGFNLILIPVNLAGVTNSLQQAVTGEKVPFRRTPKVARRTRTSLLFVLSPYLLVGLAAFTLWHDKNLHLWVNFGFAAFNALLAVYAIVAFMGIRNSLVDIWLGVVALLYKKPRPNQAARTSARPLVPEPAVTGDWVSVLHYGSDAIPDAVRRPG